MRVPEVPRAVDNGIPVALYWAEVGALHFFLVDVAHGAAGYFIWAKLAMKEISFSFSGGGYCYPFAVCFLVKKGVSVLE